MTNKQIKKLLKLAGYRGSEMLMEDFSGEVAAAHTWAAEAIAANEIDDFLRYFVEVEWDSAEGKWVEV